MPAAVYWRRRLLVLLLLLAVLGGGGWLTVAALSEGSGETVAAAATTQASTAAGEPPALAQVVPSLASVRTPTPPREPAAEGTTRSRAGTATEDAAGRVAEAVVVPSPNRPVASA